MENLKLYMYLEKHLSDVDLRFQLCTSLRMGTLLMSRNHENMNFHTPMSTYDTNAVKYRLQLFPFVCETNIICLSLSELLDAH